MTKPKHTPGPWTVQEHAGYTSASGVEVLPGEQITIRELDMEMVDDNPERNRANARLIAAAPCMLEALKRASARILSLNGPNDEAGVQCERAIAKAEGRENG